MNNFFATPEGAWGDGSVHLTVTGIVIVVVIIALLLIKPQGSTDHQTTRLLCSCYRTCRGMFHDQIV